MLFEAFKKMRQEKPDAPAFLITSGDRALPISWREFTDDIDVVSQLVRQLPAATKIGILGENSYEWMVVHAAIVFSGATAVPIDMNLTPVEIADRLKFVGASTLVYSSLYAEKVREARKLMPGLKTGGFGTIRTERVIEEIRSKFDPKKSVWNQESLDVHRISMLVFTSGTTKKPRGAELTLEGLEAFCDSAIRVLPMYFGQRSLMLLPLHHIFGVCTTYLMLTQGVALGVCPDFRRIYDAVQRFRASFLFLVPALAEILAMKIDQHGRSAEEALGNPIDWILIGGASLPRRTYEHLVAQGVKMLTGYGLTETTALYSIAPLSGDPHVGSAGKVCQSPLMETSVSDKGELLLRGPAVMKGYFKSPEATAEAIDAEGWLHTGDLGRIDEEGFVWITGRASRTIILSTGKKIAPEELEEKLHDIGIFEAVVSGDTESRDVKAEVYASIPEASVLKAIGELNLQLPVYTRIRKIVVRTEPFPRSSSGKIILKSK